LRDEGGVEAAAECEVRWRKRKISNAQAVTDSALKAMNEGGPWGPYRLAAEKLAAQARRQVELRAEREREGAAKFQFQWERERGGSPKES
jgi:hypothetical protein